MITRHRALLFCVIGFSMANSHAEETLRASNQSGLMCTDEKTLAALTANDGSLKPSALFPPGSVAYSKYCQAANGPVVLITRRKNTSIVNFQGKIWYVPNIDYVASGAAAPCFKSGTKQTLFGRTETPNARPHAPEAAYSRIKLDQPVCMMTNQGEVHGQYVSLVPTSEHSRRELLNIHDGSRYPITGVVIAPRNAADPPDSIMMLDPETNE